MAKTRRARATRGGGYGTSQQFFDPAALPPSTMFPAVSAAPTYAEIRPVLQSTFQAGGSKTRKHRGGFSPSIMGGFVANAQAAIVPAALYLVYHTMVPKKGSITSALGGMFKSRRNRRNSRRARRA
jgi:hypothetical protein